MGIVLPIAGPAFLSGLINAAQSHITPDPIVLAFGILSVGIVAGLDGSGFSGRP